MSRHVYSSANRNPDDPEPAPAPAPTRATRSSGGGLGKTILIAGLGAVVGAFGIDMYNKLFKGKGKDDGDGDDRQPQPQPIQAQIAAPAVIPMPMPYPMPMPGYGGYGGYGQPPEQPRRNPSEQDADRLQAVRGRRNAIAELRSMKQDAFDKMCEKFMEGDD